MSGMLVTRIINDYRFRRKFNGGFGLNRRLSVGSSDFGKSHKFKVNLIVSGSFTVNPSVVAELEGNLEVLSVYGIKVAYKVLYAVCGVGGAFIVKFKGAEGGPGNTVSAVFKVYTGRSSYHDRIVTIEGKYKLVVFTGFAEVVNQFDGTVLGLGIRIHEHKNIGYSVAPCAVSGLLVTVGEEAFVAAQVIEIGYLGYAFRISGCGIGKSGIGKRYKSDQIVEVGKVNVVKGYNIADFNISHCLISVFVAVIGYDITAFGTYKGACL